MILRQPAGVSAWPRRPDPPSMLLALLRTGSTHLNRGFRVSQDFRRPSPRDRSEGSTALPAVAWLTLAPKCKANVGPQPRSAVRTFVDSPVAAALSEGLLATRFGALSSSGRGRSTGQASQRWPVVPTSCARPSGPAPATTALDCQVAQVTRDGSCFRSTARCTRPKRRFCGAALGFYRSSRASLWAVTSVRLARAATIVTLGRSTDREATTAGAQLLAVVVSVPRGTRARLTRP